MSLTLGCTPQGAGLQEVVWRRYRSGCCRSPTYCSTSVVLATGFVTSNTRVRVLFGVFSACDVHSILATGALSHSLITSEVCVASTHVYASSSDGGAVCELGVKSLRDVCVCVWFGVIGVVAAMAAGGPWAAFQYRRGVS